jgi:hypothetical protein
MNPLWFLVGVAGVTSVLLASDNLQSQALGEEWAIKVPDFFCKVITTSTTLNHLHVNPSHTHIHAIRTHLNAIHDNITHASPSLTSIPSLVPFLLLSSLSFHLSSPLSQMLTKYEGWKWS